MAEGEQQIFQACLDVPGEQREECLERLCGRDEELRERVIRLLEAHARADELTFSTPALRAIAEDLETIGPYRITRVLGEGGMGTVYEAEQLEPVHRRVAVKIVKLGMDTKEVVARFRTERQALAAMDHPYVAKVFDAGQTAAGRPYFVMELVSGTGLTEYSETKRLTVRERVELLIPVCQAVQHAHQKGVLHRDLKPSNILISDDTPPTPRIIDFGIAKAIGLDSSERMTGYTRLDQALGTPAYMSPEQAGFGVTDIDTRTDVYSLGVILYELLTGTLPADPADMGYSVFLARLAAGQLPVERPSVRACRLLSRKGLPLARSIAVSDCKRQLEGDLDWIVMKAIEFDRLRRFETAEALAEDLRRFLTGLPVAARPPTVSYRLRKFVGRHRVQVAAAAVAVLALVFGMVAATVGFVRATRAEAVAHDEATASRQVSEFLVELFDLPNRQETPEKPTTVKEVLERGAATIDKDLKGQPAVQANLYITLSRVYESLGQYRPAKQFADKALSFPHAQGRERDLQTAAALMQVGSLNQKLGKMEEARRAFQKALDIRVRTLGNDDLDVALALNHLGSVYGLTERYEEGLAAHQRALEIQRRIGGPIQPDTPRSLRGLAIIEDRKGDVEAGLRLFQSAEEIFEKVYGPNHPYTAKGLQDVAVSLKALKRYDESRAMLERSLAILRNVYGPDHPEVSFTEHSLGILLGLQGKQKAALPLLEDAYRIRMAAMGPDNPRTGDVAESLGTLWVSLGNVEKGRLLLEQALRNHARAYGANHFATMETRGYLIRTLVKARRYQEAIPHLRALVLSKARGRPPIDLNDAVFDPMRRMRAFAELARQARVRSGETSLAAAR
jgi:non-specific serine/threonine protein kinase/serine/threonine-protein kinase